MRKIEYPMGSVSSGTMRNEDLIPDFVWTLRDLAEANNRKEDIELCNGLDTRMNEDGYFESEDADYDLEIIFESLNEYAAPYFYFGAHPGDGSDYGFWISEEFEYDFDGLKVSDTSEVPKNYTGEVLHINDHGNMTLYSAKKGKLTEIWAIV